VTSLLLDVLLAGVLPILAWRALATDDVHEAVVQFIALGLLSVVAWARLDAPDIALVEAAVGAGVTGALLVTSLRVLGPQRQVPPARRGSQVALAVLVVAGLAGIGLALEALPATTPGLGDEVRASLSEAGVGHPVTAVLLDLRSYDTLLEVAVLLVAVLTATSRVPESAAGSDDPTRPLVAMLVRLLVPGIVLVTGYLLWRGAAAPGGAFQAAAVLAGGGILAILAGGLLSPELRSARVRAVLALGPCVFLVIAAVPLAGGAHLLEYPSGWAGPLIFTIELVLTISIALVLLMFFPSATRRANSPGEDPA
jgi:multisubunit Na+/H+ antiporter MnhB subunit